MANKNIHDLCEEKARKGDGSFAIAFALLQLADAQAATAKSLDKLGFNDSGQPNGPPGTTESLAIEAKRIADYLADRSN